MSTPLKLHVFTVYKPGTFATLVRLFTTPLTWILSRRNDVPEHVGLMFEMEDGSMVTAEALAMRDWVCSRPWQDTVNEVKVSGKGAWLKTYALDLPPEVVQTIYGNCKKKQGVWTYNTHQLLHMAQLRFTGHAFRATPNEVVCSEAVARLLEGWIAFMKAARIKKFDYVTPVDVVITLERLGYTPERIV